MKSLTAPAKINLALVVGPRREDGKHELMTVYERIGLADTLSLEPADDLEVEGFPADTLVTRALMALAAAAGVEPGWRISIEKQIPVGAGLAGGSSDAAAALTLANETLVQPLAAAKLHELAAALGADVPLFLTTGPQLGEGDGTQLTQLELPRDYCVLVLLPDGEQKPSTKSVYDAFDDRGGEVGYEERRAELVAGLREVSSVRDFARWPKNDLVKLGARRRAGTSGGCASRRQRCRTGPLRLFEDEEAGRRAEAALVGRGRVWVEFPAWYG